MENECHFVNSRGILKSCSFHSKNPKSSCNNDYGYLIDMVKNNKMFDGMTIYVCSELILYFFKVILPKINKKFVLVTGDSDLCIPKQRLNNNEFNLLINSKYLIKWYAQNTQIQNHDKIQQLPIGLDYHTILNNKNHKWKMSNESHIPKEQETILLNIIKNSKPFYERIPKIYVNFSKENDRFGDRKNSLKIIPKHLLEKNDGFTPRTKNWMNVAQYTFVLSPFGVGMDCHRTWETLCLGSIPIVRAPNFRKLFEDLPVLIVNNWNEVNEELLKKTIRNYKDKTFHYDKLKLQYWVDKINLFYTDNTEL
jgi:hypothetical protein